MPRDSNGIYSLPNGYLAVAGQTIQPSQHNPPFEDVATALTNSLPRNGAAPMTDQLKLTDGSAGAPALGFNSTAGCGLYKTASGIAVAIGGSIVAEFTASGLVGLPIGTPIPLLDDGLPALCVWADGRNLNRTTYAALFAKWGVRYGAGDGSTTFGVPDLRGRSLIGRDNFGGSDAGRLVGVPFISADRLTSGATLGEGLHALTIAELAAHTHPGSNTDSQGAHAHLNNYAALTTSTVSTGGAIAFAGQVPANTEIAGTHNHNVNVASQGLGSGHNNVQPSMTCNWAIYAGA